MKSYKNFYKKLKFFLLPTGEHIKFLGKFYSHLSCWSGSGFVSSQKNWVRRAVLKFGMGEYSES